MIGADKCYKSWKLAAVMRKSLRVLSCSLLIVFLSCSAYAGAVKSKGVPRVVDGPQGEVIVTSVLDDQGVKVNDYKTGPDNNMPAASTKTPKPKKSEPNVNNIEYKDSPINPEDVVEKQSNFGISPLVIGIIVLLIGLGVFFILKKKR